MSDQPISPVEDSEIDLLHVFAVIWRRKGLIAGGTLIVLVAAWFACINLPKVYQVTVKLWPVYTPTIAELWSVYTPKIAGETTRTPTADRAVIVEPIVGFFQNHTLAGRAVGEFDLNKSPFHLTPEAFLNENIEVKIERTTGLIDFQVELTDPALAWEVANYMAREGIKTYTELVRKKFLRDKEYIENELNENRIQLEKERNMLIGLQKEVNLASLTERKLFLQTHSDELGAMIVQTEIEIVGKEAEILVLEDAVMGNSQRLESKASIFSGEKKTTEETEPPNNAFGSLSLLSERLNDIFENTEVRLIRSKAEYASLKASREQMEKNRREILAELAIVEERLASSTIEEEKLRSKLDLTTRMFELSQQKFANIKSASEMLVQQIAIVDAGGIPETPVRPRILLITALSGAVALLLFFFLAFLLEEAARRRQTQAGAKS